MMNLPTVTAMIATLAVGSVLISGTAIAEDYYPDKFKHRTDVPSVSEGSGIPAQYRLR